MTLEAIYKQVLEEVDHAIIIVNKAEDIILWNKKAAEILGVKKDFTKKNAWQNHFRIFKMDGSNYHNGDLPIRRALNGEIVSKERLYISTGIDEGKYLDVDAFPILEGKSIAAGAASFCDVTKNMKTQKFVEEVTKMLEHIKTLIRDSFFSPIDLNNLPPEMGQTTYK